MNNNIQIYATVDKSKKIKNRKEDHLSNTSIPIQSKDEYAAVNKSRKTKNRKEDHLPNVPVQSKDEYAVVDKSKISKKTSPVTDMYSCIPQTDNYEDTTSSNGGTNVGTNWSDSTPKSGVSFQTKIPPYERETSHRIGLKDIDYKSLYRIAGFIVIAITLVIGFIAVTTAFTLIASLQSELSSTKQVVENLMAFGNSSTCDSTNNLSLRVVAGFYEVRNSNESFALLHCSPVVNENRNSLRKVADLNVNVTGSSTQCPRGFELQNTPFSCRANKTGAGCTSFTYSVRGIPYSYITGRIIARQYLTPDAFAPTVSSRNNTVEGNYVDGVSLTYGNNPRNHIWTFAAGLTWQNQTCDDRCQRYKPSFVGNNFSCEINDVCDSNAPSCGDPLWDGNQCYGPTTFYRELLEPTTENIEMRVCRDDDQTNEDILLTLVELYVL